MLEAYEYMRYTLHKARLAEAYVEALRHTELYVDYKIMQQAKIRSRQEGINMKIVVLDGYTENPGDLSWSELEKLGSVTAYDRTAYAESPLIAERIGDAEVVVINKTPISKETIDKCPNIKTIAVLATGYNVVDYEYAKSKGIQIFNAPGLNANAVAELTISKMLDISRGTFTANYDVKVKHEWNKYKFEGRELRGKTLGVMGFGRIGKRVGELGRAFGMTVVAYDPFLKPEDFEKEHATGMSVDEMLKVADFVSIHVPLTPETKDLFNAKSIAEMKDDAVVLNMSRGGIVNEKDMYEALKAGKIGGYAADVMENELAGSGLTGDDTFASPLFECDNFIVSPHIGAQSVDASRDIGLHIISKVKEALSL